MDGTTKEASGVIVGERGFWMLPLYMLPGIGTAVISQEVSLVAHFPLNEGRGPVAYDVGPHGLEARIQGATWVQCANKHVLAFDGIDDYVRCDDERLDLHGPITLSAWVWAEETPTTEVGIAGKQFSSYLLTYYTDRKAWWYIGSGTNHATAPVLTGCWRHLVGTFDGRRLRLYVNGELIDEEHSTFSSIPSGGAFFVGCVLGDPTAPDPAYAKSGYFKGYIADVRVYAGALSTEQIAAQYHSEVKKHLSGVVEKCTPIAEGVTISEGALRVRIGNSGAVEVRRDGGFCVLESSFSYPGDKLGKNWLSERCNGVESGWNPTFTKAEANAIRVTARGAYYRLERIVRLRSGRVEIEDTLCNLSEEPIGMFVHHQVVTPQAILEPRLGYGAADPIVFGTQRRYDVGLVAEDDVSRAQFAPFASANRLGFHLDHFGLGAGCKRTLRWATYLLPPSGDPLAFINRVRADWGSNHTVLGPGSFFDATDPILRDPTRLRAYLTRRKLGIAMLSPWLDYDPGSMDRVMTRAEYKETMQRAVAAIRAADPTVKCLGCIETDWVTIDPKAIPGGQALPVDGFGGHGPTWISIEQTKILEAAGLPWQDSMKRDAEGRAILELYSRGGKPQTALGVYPRIGNYQAQFLLEQAQFILEEVGLDGFYIDEFAPYWVRSYDRWDGVTVDIDPATGRIVRMYTDAALVGAEFREKLCKYALSRGATVVANTFATTGAENALPVLRFAETWSSFDVLDIPKTGKPPFNQFLASGQLGTPIGLGVLAPSDRPSTAELLVRALILYLRHGLLYYHYFFGDVPEQGEGSGEYGPINHAFPITPVELFEGGIIGRERIISCVSRRFRWPATQKPTVLVFGRDGRQVPSDTHIVRAKEGWSIMLRLDDWNQIAVIE